MSEIEARVQAAVAAYLDVDPGRLTPEATLGDDLCVDSLSAIELAMVLEDEFQVTLPEDDLARIRTYGDVVGLVREQASGDAPSTR